jgi:hypothetical protein
MLFLAQISADDWIQFAIIAAIIIVSVIVNIVNSLSRKLRGDRQEDEKTRRRPIPPIPRGEWADLPTAEPTPPRPVRREPIRTQVERPMPPHAPRPPCVYKAPPPMAQPVRETPPAPPPVPRVPPSQPQRTRKTAEVVPAAPKPRVSPAARREFAEAVGGRELPHSIDAAERMGHVDPGLVAPLPELDLDILVNEEELGGKPPHKARFSRRTLRDGIILAEILGAPVSLRGGEPDHF